MGHAFTMEGGMARIAVAKESVETIIIASKVKTGVNGTGEKGQSAGEDKGRGDVDEMRLHK